MSFLVFLILVVVMATDDGSGDPLNQAFRRLLENFLQFIPYRMWTIYEQSMLIRSIYGNEGKLEEPV